MATLSTSSQQLQVVEAIWNQQLMPQLTKDNVGHVAVMQRVVFLTLDDFQVETLRLLMLNYTDQVSMFVRDILNAGHMLLGPRISFYNMTIVVAGEEFYHGGQIDAANAFAKKAAVVATPSPIDAATSDGTTAPTTVGAQKDFKIPRPPNAWILYRKDKHPAVVAAHPLIRNNEISCILGAQWKDEPAEVRQSYHAKAEAIKRAFMQKHPFYKFQPRRSHEIRRRAPRIPHPAHVNAAQVSFTMPLAHDVARRAVLDRTPWNQLNWMYMFAAGQHDNLPNDQESPLVAHLLRRPTTHDQADTQ